MRPRHPLLIMFCFLAAACSSASSLRLEVPLTQFRSSAAPLTSLVVVMGADMRSHEERGLRKILSTSGLEDSSMAAPTTVGALAALRRDVLRSGVAATEAPVEASAYVLEITFVHLAGTWSTGPETLALVVPVVAVAGYCEFRATLRDRHGRVFLEKTVSSRKEAHATPVASPASAAADLLGFAVSEAIEELLPLLVPAVETWWRARDLPPRREPALNPLPAPRSNTDR